MDVVQAVLAGEQRWCIVAGDNAVALASMPDLSVDHILSDAPYSDHVHGVGRMDLAIRAGERDFGFESLGATLRTNIATQAARLVRRWFVMFTDAEGQAAWMGDLLAAGLQHVRVGAWVKPGALPQMSGDRPSAGFEAIEIAHRPGRKRWNGGGKSGIWTHTIQRGDVRWHPTQKPLPLLIELIEDFTDPGEIVLDPFCGSGSIGIACLRLGRRYIGMELNSEWAERARAWLQAEDRHSTLRATEAGQRSLF
jgi:hypothetical protein